MINWTIVDVNKRFVGGAGARRVEVRVQLREKSLNTNLSNIKILFI